MHDATLAMITVQLLPRLLTDSSLELPLPADKLNKQQIQHSTLQQCLSQMTYCSHLF